METNKILTITFLIGIVLFITSGFQIIKSKGKIKKSNLALLAATLICILPMETADLVTENSTANKIGFIMTFLSLICIVLNFASDTKEK